MIKRFGTNCLLVDGQVYSYETKVAIVNDHTRQLTQLGYWSKTTQKHINMVARFLGYEVTKPKNN
jgi:hypothetical protein